MGWRKIGTGTSSIMTWWDSINGIDIFNINSGNVGVGTQSPQSKLHVLTDNNDVSLFETTNILGRTKIKSSALEYQIDFSNYFSIKNNLTSNYLFYSNANDNIGINTNSPTHKLTIRNDGVFGNFNVTTYGGASQFRIERDGRVYIGNPQGSPTFRYRLNVEQFIWLDSSSGGDLGLYFSTNGSSRYYFKVPSNASYIELRATNQTRKFYIGQSGKDYFELSATKNYLGVKPSLSILNDFTERLELQGGIKLRPDIEEALLDVDSQYKSGSLIYSAIQTDNLGNPTYIKYSSLVDYDNLTNQFFLGYYTDVSGYMFVYENGFIGLSKNKFLPQARLHIKNQIGDNAFIIDTSSTNGVFKIKDDGNIYIDAQPTNIYGVGGQRLLMNYLARTYMHGKEFQVYGNSYLGLSGVIVNFGHDNIGGSLLNFTNFYIGDKISYYKQNFAVTGNERIRFDFANQIISHSENGVEVSNNINSTILSGNSWKEQLIGWWYNGTSAEQKIISRQNIVNNDGTYHYLISNNLNELLRVYYQGDVEIMQSGTNGAGLILTDEITGNRYRVVIQNGVLTLVLI